MPRSRQGGRSDRSPACRSRSKTCSMSKGLATRAGSKINRDLKPAARDATLMERLEAAGAVLVGALNMGEYAYDFTGENVHDGPSRNPHDPTRMTGGSSGGSGSAVGGGAGADCAGVGHQRFDPGAGVVLRNLWIEADLRPAVAGAVVSRSSQASIISARSRATSMISRWPMMRCRDRILPMPPARRGLSSR